MKLCIPDKLLEQHLAVLGKTGKGKSSVLRYLVEHLLAQNKRVCVIDPKGDWWGLKLSADGKGNGFDNIVMFGDFKDPKAQDVPLNAQAGKHVAELIAKGNRPCVIGFRGWMPGARTKFWIDFAATLFNQNAGELYLIGDEFHNFAPKGRIMSPEAGMCLHWSNTILAEGRGLGIVCMIASQRPQKVHNDTLTCCETLVAMGMNHPADRNAVAEWIDGCGDKVTGATVINSVASLQRGEAFVWSPENEFGPKRLAFPMFTTFDSFAPPQLQKRVTKANWTTVNLDDIKAKLQSVIAEELANNPQELRRQIINLKKQLASRQPEQELQVEPAVTPEQEQALSEIISRFETVEASVKQWLEEARESYKVLNSILGTLKANSFASKPIKINPPKPVVMKSAGAGSTDGLNASCIKILQTVEMLHRRRIYQNRECIAKWMGIHPNGGTYSSNLANLRSSGYLEGCNLTADGMAIVATEGRLETGIEAAKQPLNGSERNIVEALEDGSVHSRESLAQKLGIHPNGGTYSSSLARLRKMGLIPERGEIRLTNAALL